MTFALLIGILVALSLYLWGIFEAALDISAGIPAPTEYAFLVMSIVAIVAVFLRVAQ